MFRTRLLSGIVLVAAALVLIITGKTVLLAGCLVFRKFQHINCHDDDQKSQCKNFSVRNKGESKILRLSNYLLWQIAYSELYFTDVPWPDFTKKELVKAIKDYNSRDRRYGGVKEE